MIDPNKLLSQLATRMEAVISKDSDPQSLMSQLLEQAESAGLLDAQGGIRSDSPSLFVQDLITDNPRALEWAQQAREWLKPLQINDRLQLLDAIQ